MDSSLLLLLVLSSVLCRWTNVGMDSYNSKMNPYATSSPNGWQIPIGDLSHGSLAITSDGELLFPYYDSGHGCIQKVALEDGHATGNVCWPSGDDPRAGLLPKWDGDLYVFLEKAEGLRSLRISTMELQNYSVPDFSYYENYVLSGHYIVYASRGMCPGSYEVCLNVSCVTIGEMRVRWKVSNIPCSSEECYLTEDNLGNAFLIDDTSLYHSNRTNHVWWFNVMTGQYDTFPIPEPTYKQVSRRVAATPVAYYFVQRTTDYSYKMFAMPRDTLKPLWIRTLMTTPKDTPGDCSDLSVAADEDYVYTVCSFNGIDFRNNTLFVVETHAGRIISKTDYTSSLKMSSRCTKLNLLANGNVVVWCLEVFGTSFVLVDQKGGILAHEINPFGKAQMFVDPVSDGSNNVYFQTSVFMEDSYLNKKNFGGKSSDVAAVKT